jgi:hypothetical protein
MYWYDFTDASGDYKIGLCFTKAKAKRYARMFDGTYRGRWRPGFRMWSR